jgi:2-polyprenyl-3-methyl-5-hydroxy-6-metoxy-1,4-benzoquinol methylase
VGADRSEWIEGNREWWDERAPSHAGGDFYDLDSFRTGSGGDRLRPFEGDELGIDPAGLDLVHLQCHIGTDTLSWASRGASVTGLDFSEPALEAARRLAADIGIPAEFVRSDVYDAAAALGHRRFDVVYTGCGALTWLPDIERWAEVVASLLRPGGVLYLVEIHPFLWPFDDDTEEPVVAWPYFGPIVWHDATGSYTDRELKTEHNTTHEQNWGIGAVITAIVRAGLVIELVAEHPLGVEQVWPFMERVEGAAGGWWIMPPDRPQLPLLWSLRARLGPA